MRSDSLINRPRAALLVAASAFAGACLTNVWAQGREGFTDSFKNPAINYENAPRTDAVGVLVKGIQSGQVRLTFEPQTGYLRSLLDALKVSIDSQVVVFSQTSQQAPLINPKNPRAIYYSDHVAVGYVRGATALEIAAHDPRQGVGFYRVEQKAVGKPAFVRNQECLQCHVSWDTFAVPGVFVLNTGPLVAGYATGGVTDHRDEIANRWGGWFLTPRSIPGAHMGTTTGAPRWLAERYDQAGYLSPHSDVVALMVLEHQTRMMNFLTYIGWEARVGANAARLKHIAHDLVDYLLFVDEAPLAGKVQGSSTFADRFAAEGVRDSRGRSLRQLDLTRRLMKYPCSYMIYSAAFDALPAAAKTAVYDRMRQVLTGQDTDSRYSVLSRTDRQAILEILGETKKDWPARP